MYQIIFSSIQKAGLISKEYHTCIILKSIDFFRSVDDMSICLAVALLVNRWKCWGAAVSQLELEGLVGLWARWNCGPVGLRARWKAPPHSPDQLAGACQVLN